MEEAQRRGHYGEERYEREAFQRKAIENYAKLRDNNWKIVDAALASETIAHTIAELADVAVREASTTPLREDLWLS